jgi:alkylated DNA nucleotide flippase Atl1
MVIGGWCLENQQNSSILSWHKVVNGIMENNIDRSI